MEKNTVITISRQFGSGGRYIAKSVAEKLNIPFYDKDIIKEISKKSGLDHDLVESYDEKSTNSLLYSLSLGAYNYNYFRGHYEMPLGDRIFSIQSDIIKDIAKKGPCVIVGRCSESILRNIVPTFNVFIYADNDLRITRVTEYENISRADASDYIRKMDKKRANYHNFYSDYKWGDTATYDLCIKSNIGIENAAQIIVDCYNLK